MSVRTAGSLLAAALVLAVSADAPMAAPETKKPADPTNKKSAAKPTSPPGGNKPGAPKTTPAPPTPGPSTPSPAKPATSPAKPAGSPSKSDPAAPGDPRNTAVMKAIETRERSEDAGAVFKQFLDAKTVEARLALILDPAKNGPALEKYFANSPNHNFKPMAVQILGSVSSPSAPDQTIFPYFVATDKNMMGFLTAVVQTKDGFKVDWPTFERGHDQSLEDFLAGKKQGEAKTFLLGIAKTHIFGDAPAGGEAKWTAYVIEMPLPREDQDPAKIFVEKESEIGRNLATKLGWAKGHLCFLTLVFDGGEKAFLKVTGYEPYAR
jgi:hypothetical protein